MKKAKAKGYTPGFLLDINLCLKIKRTFISRCGSRHVILDCILLLLAEIKSVYLKRFIVIFSYFNAVL